MNKNRLYKIYAFIFAFACLLGISSIAYAETYINNPGAFVDVPAGHWSYSAINKLASEGIITGDKNGNFSGDRILTRYEMAIMVAKSMACSDKADAETKELIEKLIDEYNSELVNIGARVVKTEQAIERIERFVFHGDFRIRYRNLNYNHGSDDGDKDIRFRLMPTIKVNDKWIVSSELAMAENWRSSNDDNDMNSVKMMQIYTQGPLGRTGVNLTLGKFVYWGGGGPGERTWSPMGNTLNLAMNAVAIKGAKLSFGKELRTDIVYGRANTQFPQYVDYNYVHPGNAGFNGKNITVYGIATRWSPTKNLDFQLNYHDFKSKSNVFGNEFNAANDELRLVEFGGMYQFDKNWRFTAIAAHSDADKQNNAYKVEIRYKNADLSKSGTWALFGTYINIEANSIWRADDPGQAIWISPSMFKNTAGTNLGVKGWSLEAAYVVTKNSLLRAVYGKYKEATGTSVQGKTKLFQLQYDMLW